MHQNTQVVLVTGGAHRVGRAIALAFARTGAHVAISYHRSGAQATETVAALEQHAPAAAFPADLSDTIQAEQLGDAVQAHFGRVDVLVNCAGVWESTPLGTATEAQWEALLNTNARGAFFLTQRLAPALRAARGAIVNIADIGAVQPWPSYTPYLISKGALVSMTYALAKELAPDVRVNAISPGPVLMPDDWTDEQRQKTASTTLLKRLGRPEDVADAAVFLAQAPFITGVVLPVDGGKLLR